MHTNVLSEVNSWKSYKLGKLTNPWPLIANSTNLMSSNDDIQSNTSLICY